MSIYAEKSFDKIQLLFIIKLLSTLQIEKKKTSFVLKRTYTKQVDKQANIKLELQKAQKSSLTSSIQHSSGSSCLASAIRQIEKKKKI